MPFIPTKKQDKIIAIILVILVMGTLVPCVAVMAYQNYRQQQNLNIISDFIKVHGDALLAQKFGNTDKLYRFTGNGGQLWIQYVGKMDKNGLEKWVHNIDPKIGIYYTEIKR